MVEIDIFKLIKLLKIFYLGSNIVEVFDIER